MLFIGIVYASLSILLVHFIISKDPILSNYSGMIIITFCVMFSTPFLYNMIKKEETEDEQIKKFEKVWNVHKDAIYAFMWLFIGFIIAFSVWNALLQNSDMFEPQLETYCEMNNLNNFEICVDQNSFNKLSINAAATKNDRFLSILQNNISVMVFSFFFSLIFGAGAIFILAWNASVIAVAIGIFTKYDLSLIPLGLARYMIHGLPEIASYFMIALAAGIFGVNVKKNTITSKKSLRVTKDSAFLILIAYIVLIIAAFIEVYITPLFF